HDPTTCARKRRNPRGLHPGAGAGLPDPGHVLCGGSCRGRAQLRACGRGHRGGADLHPLCGRARGRRPRHWPRAVAVLGGLGLGGRSLGDLSVGAVRGRELPHAQARGRTGGRASGLAPLRARGLRGAVRVPGGAGGGAGRGGDRGARPVRHRQVQGQPPLPGRARRAAAM
ncbi:MAG: Putative permease often clustered with de novo purine synthesis, partial [uncultured Rubellimicrobium sp.]